MSFFYEDPKRFERMKETPYPHPEFGDLLPDIDYVTRNANRWAFVFGMSIVAAVVLVLALTVYTGIMLLR
jgi:uncharacterized membrane protein YkgB